VDRKLVRKDIKSGRNSGGINLIGLLLRTVKGNQVAGMGNEEYEVEGRQVLSKERNLAKLVWQNYLLKLDL
jgi:hypothetical protein